MRYYYLGWDMSFVCVCNERDLMTDGIKVQASARAPSDGAFGVLIEPLQQMGRVASVSTILTPQKPRRKWLAFSARFRCSRTRAPCRRECKGRNRQRFLGFWCSAPRGQRTTQVHHANCTALTGTDRMSTQSCARENRLIHRLGRCGGALTCCETCYE